MVNTGGNDGYNSADILPKPMGAPCDSLAEQRSSSQFSDRVRDGEAHHGTVGKTRDECELQN